MIILSGSHSYLGSALLPLLRDSYQVCAFDNERGDIRDRSFVEKLCSEINPSIFINCAQMDNVEECEYKREDAYTLNGKVPAFLSEICAMKKIFLVQISSHYVFDGEQDEPYKENDTTHPRTVFGDSMDYAEKKIQSSGAEHLIVRLPHLYGRDGGFLSHYIEKMKTGESIPVISDQIIIPTFVADAAKMILSAVQAGMKGVVHCANEGLTPLAQFLYEVERSYSRASGKGLVVNIQSYAPSDFLSPCDLPVNNTLDISLFKKETSFAPRHWKEALDDFMSSNFQYL